MTHTNLIIMFTQRKPQAQTWQYTSKHMSDTHLSTNADKHRLAWGHGPHCTVFTNEESLWAAPFMNINTIPAEIKSTSPTLNRLEGGQSDHKPLCHSRTRRGSGEDCVEAKVQNKSDTVERQALSVSSKLFGTLRSTIRVSAERQWMTDF